MVETFGIVLFVVVFGALVVGVLTLSGARRSYDEIGRGDLSLNEEADAPRRSTAPAAGTSAAVADAEVRQMVEAKNARRARRGEPPLDVEAEIARLTPAAGPARVAVDAELRAEVRALVTARNARRVRAGEPPLDVEAEVERRIADLAKGAGPPESR